MDRNLGFLSLAMTHVERSKLMVAESHSHISSTIKKITIVTKSHNSDRSFPTISI